MIAEIDLEIKQNRFFSFTNEFVAETVLNLQIRVFVTTEVVDLITKVIIQ